MPKTKLSEYSRAYAVRFRKPIEKDLNMFCVDKEVRISRVIQTAVECFLRNPDCQSRKKLMEGLL